MRVLKPTSGTPCVIAQSSTAFISSFAVPRRRAEASTTSDWTVTCGDFSNASRRNDSERLVAVIGSHQQQMVTFAFEQPYAARDLNFADIISELLQQGAYGGHILQRRSAYSDSRRGGCGHRHTCRLLSEGLRRLGRAPDLLQAGGTAAGGLVVLIAVRVFLVVVLVVVLGHPEGSRGKNPGGDLLLEPARRLERLLALLGDFRLRLAVGEDGRVIGAALVAELALGIDRIDVAPEPVDKLRVADLGGIVGHLHCLVVAGRLGGDLFVGRLVDGTAGVAGDRAEHARHLLEGFFHAPEAAAREGGDGDRAVALASLGGRRH